MLLLLTGVVGVAFELSHPGVYAPGVIGAICLLLGGYGLNLLPIGYAGVALALLGLGLMMAEAFVPSFGAFVLGGAVAFVIGSVMMFDASDAHLPLALIVGATAVCALLFGVVLELAATRPPAAGGHGYDSPGRPAGAGDRLGRRRGRGDRAGRTLARERRATAGAGRCGARGRPVRADADRGGGVMVLGIVYPVIAVLILAFASTSIRVMREYQRAVIFTLGRFTGVKGPGLFLLVPYVQQMVRVDLRTVVLDVPSQDVISRDNVSVKVNAVLYFRVVDPTRP